MESEFDGLPEGSRWHRSALQVNPYSYLVVHNKAHEAYSDEDDYNSAVVDALVESAITVIGITDHWCVDSGQSLRAAAEAAGITVFPGFEATTKDGVHLLVLFEPGTDAANINRNIGECGIPADCRESRPGLHYAIEMLECAERWGAAVVAPHVNTGGGLLDKLSGQSAVLAWTNPRLRAAAPGGGAINQGHTAILANNEPAYRRTNAVAILRAADVSSPSDVSKPGSSCWIKLSSQTVTGLDLAFRTPDTRVSHDDPTDCTHPRIVGVGWDGGFLDGAKIRLNESLNVLIGGRGSGKSTVIESLRYVFDIAPLARASQSEHLSVVNDVLGSGTKVHVEVELRTPSKTTYFIERLVGSAPVVRSSSGDLLSSSPADLLAGVEIYGQRELAELARDKHRLTSLIARYLPHGTSLGEPTSSERAELQGSRTSILALQADVEALEMRLAQLPVVEERLARFDDAGVAEKLGEQDRAQQEHQLLKRALSSLPDLAELSDLSVESVYLNDAIAASLPRAEMLGRAKTVVDSFNIAVAAAIKSLETARRQALTDLTSLEVQWTEETKDLREGLAKILRDLQPDGIDGGEYLRLRRQLGDLEPVADQVAVKQRELSDLVSNREELLIAVEDQRATRLRALQQEAKKVGRRLPGIVRASVRDGDNRSVLTDLLDQALSGRLDRVRSAIEAAPSLSPRAFVRTCRQGAEAIVAEYSAVTAGQATLLASASEETLMKAEEVEFPISTDLELNLGTKESPNWRSLDHLSTGQKATALLLLLMHRGDGPLIIDQPEDDLDNRFIYDDIVPRLRETKDKRQVIFSSHNANIPVLGDADQIVSLAAEDTGGGVCGRIVEDGLGSIDHPPVRAMVEEILEGGRQAFNTRRYLYGF